jgi:predicted acetyltransferase
MLKPDQPITTEMDPVLRFEEPHAGLQDSYRSLVREFIDRGEPLVPFTLAFPNEDFSAFLDRLSACAKGRGIPVGFVPHTTYWLVRDGSEVVGVSNLRHRLTEALRIEGGHIGYGVRPTARRCGFATQLLRHTLARARDLGVVEAWLTCAKTNEASIRTILRNGGVFVSEDFVPTRGEPSCQPRQQTRLENADRCHSSKRLQ